MTRHFEKELADLRSTLIRMASVVEEAVQKATTAIMERDTALAQSVIEGDPVVDDLELRIDNKIVDILALQQPVASDLRLILAATKINNDLERIGDHAVNLAESAVDLASKEHVPEVIDRLMRMTQITKRMLLHAIDSFVHVDANIGEAVVLMDDSVDDLNIRITGDLLAVMKEHPEKIDAAIGMIRVSRNLERVADLATNIAEEAVFVAKAKVIKHHAAEKSDEAAADR